MTNNNNKDNNMNYEVIEHLDNITHEQWLDLRSTGIGGSDCAAVFGESPYTSPLTLWAQKSGRVERDVPTNEAMEWGNLLEDVVASKFARDHNKVVVKWPVMLRSRRLPHMLANLDFVIMADDSHFEAGTITTWNETTPPPGIIDSILEIKTAGLVGRYSTHQWDDDGVPTGYWYQGLHYSTVTGISSVTYAALVAGSGLVVRERFYNEGDHLTCELTEAVFWTNVTSGTPPEVDGSPSTSETISELYPTSTETTIEADEFMLETYKTYCEAKSALTELERRVKQLRAQLEMGIGSSEAVTYNGETLFTYKSTKDTEAFDAKLFKTTHPDLYKEFVKPKSGYRVMRMKGEL